MAGEKILIVDDDENVHEILSLYLEKEDFIIYKALDGKEALNQVDDKNPDLIILDIMMPQMDGREVIRELRKENEVPIIFLSARSEEFDRVLGLELGGDDYVTKPFSPREVAARVKAVLKRVGKKDKVKQEVLQFPDLKIIPTNREVRVRDKEIRLSPKEYDLLQLLARHPQQVFSRDRLYERVWGMDSYGDYRSVDVHINWLRDKLNLDYIKTVWGIGYKFEVEEDV